MGEQQLAELEAAQIGLSTRDQLSELEFTRKAIRYRVAQGRLVRLPQACSAILQLELPVPPRERSFTYAEWQARVSAALCQNGPCRGRLGTNKSVGCMGP